MSVEDRVRGSLSRHASDVDPSADSWDRIVQRVREGESISTPPPSRGRRITIIAAALAIFALAVVPLLIIRHGAAPAPTPPAASGVSPVPSPSTPLSAVNPCRAGQLSAREIVTDGAAGNVWAPIVLENASTTACSLAGYPDLRFLGASGNDLGLRAVHSPDYTGVIPPSPIPRVPFVLPPGAKAWFIVSFEDVQPPCTRVFSLAISPVGSGGAVPMHVNPTHQWEVCSGGPAVTAMTLDRPRGV